MLGHEGVRQAPALHPNLDLDAFRVVQLMQDALGISSRWPHAGILTPLGSLLNSRSGTVHRVHIGQLFRFSSSAHYSCRCRQAA